MSDDYHRPTYTSANATNEPTNADGHYNPTQVRLYGIPGKPGLVFSGPKAAISSFDGAANIRIDLSEPDKARQDIDHVIEVLKALRKDPKRQTLEARAAWPGPIVIPVGSTYQLGLTMKLFGTVYLGSESKGESTLSSGIMFGYAYEGHTYEFPKPKIMLVPSQPLVGRIPDDDSGYDAKYDEGYRVWLVDKLDQCVEVEINQGFVDEIVLEANMPGKRSPTAYRAAMSLSHRGGRLSE
ncbi:hypothetical protein G5V57_11660 [Nordella sp. HKS 07]|uniref:hypothetical protein n=1 Tax=Nordella sp. HKS 07 TaxID=2712222 RepID=UPI0013E14174|nr:hypothetical protein [Nordella sp. HKS 07]QIG48322.1 hypothetical protein G5V57_11660 [Nordella sp. HKS 07]